MVLPIRAHHARVTAAALVLLGFLVVPANAQDPGRRAKVGPTQERLQVRARPALPSWLGQRSYPAPGTSPQPRLAWPAAVPAVVTPESEPNDQPASAQLVALGDTVSGALNPAGDIDVFAIDLLADSLVLFDVDARSLPGGSDLDSYLTLYGPDSVTVLAENDDWNGLDSRLLYAAPADGRYFLRVSPYSWGSGGSTHVYVLSFVTPELDETEPNDSHAEANVLGLGDSPFTAVIAPMSDVDYFAVDVADVGLLRVNFEAWGYFPALVTLYDTDGITPLDTVDVYYEWPWRVQAYVAAPGRYYASVEYGHPEQPSQQADVYSLAAEFLPAGPGDPTTLFASGLGYPWELVTDWSGNLLVLDYDNDRVYRVGGSGTVSTFATLSQFYAYGMAVDGFGDVLVAGWDLGRDRSGIWRVDPSGARTWFTADTTSGAQYATLAMGPDGDIWAHACLITTCPVLARLDPLGNLRSTIPLSDGVSDMAFSPAGDLHFSNGYDAVYRVQGTSIQRVIQTTSYVEGIAFDEDGYLYLGNGYLERVSLFSPAYVLQDSAFATTNLSGPVLLAFLRGTDGAMTSRLFATNGGGTNSSLYGTMVEMNPAGVRAAGLGVGAQLLRVANADLPSGLVGSEYADTLTILNPPGGTVSWELLAGSLPPGLALGASNGVISGIPTDTGNFAVSVRATAGDRFGFGRFTIAIGEPTITVTDAVDAALGVDGALTPDGERFLDIRGNNNGLYDIGDLRAFLRAQEVLAAPPVDAAAVHGKER